MKRFFFILLAIFLLFAGLYPLPIRVDGVLIELPISNYDEYLEYIAQANVPEYYVLYAHIQSLGSFQRYHRNYPATASYVIQDENGEMLVFSASIRKNLTSTWGSHLVMPMFAADMRKLDAQKSGIVIRGPLRYYYEMGMLICIRWHLGDTEFYIGMDGAPYLGGYPTDGKTAICSRLLSHNYLSALSAYYDTIRNIPKQPGETVFSRIWPVISFVASIVFIPLCFIAVCVFLSCRKRKNNKCHTQPRNCT